MTRSRVLAWMLIALACPAALAEEDFVAAQPLQEAGLVKFWQLRLPLDKGQVVRDAYLLGDQLYVGTQDGYVFAVHAYTGVLRWLQPVTRSGYHVRRPAHFGEQVIFVTPTDIQVYDQRTGEGLIRRDLRFPPGTAVISDGKQYFIGGIDQRLYAYDAATHYLDWRIVVDGPINSTPALYGNFVFVANDRGTVCACTKGNKAFHWNATAYGAITADLVANESGVYAACRDQSLYLFDLEVGQVRWRARFSGPLYEPPALTSDVVYQYCPADGLVAVENAVIGVDERLRWKLPQGRAALTVDPQHVFVLTGDGNILAVRIKDGKVEMVIPAPGFTLGIPAIEENTIFVASPDGRLFCARPRSVPFLKQDDILAALRPTAASQPTSQPTTQPASQPSSQPAEKAIDLLKTKRGGAPIGGKSKISREYSGGEGG